MISGELSLWEEKIMKINFTNKEYELLVSMVSIADWILHSNKVGGHDKDYTALQQKILSHAKDFGREDVVQFNKEHNEYFVTSDFEQSDRMLGAVDEFVEDIFWQELADRLTMRDLFMRFGEETVRNMTLEEKVHHHTERENQYLDEFDEHGLDRIAILSTGPHSGTN